MTKKIISLPFLSGVKLQGKLMGKFHTKIVGVTHKTPNGKDRQKIISKFCKEGMPLELIPEPDNKHDSNAIGIWLALDGFFSSNKYHLGYISEEIACRLSDDIQGGKEVDVYIKNVTGGSGNKAFGVNITIET